MHSPTKTWLPKMVFHHPLNKTLLFNWLSHFFVFILLLFSSHIALLSVPCIYILHLLSWIHLQMTENSK